jgi:hypothetical protein
MSNACAKLRSPNVWMALITTPWGPRLTARDTRYAYNLRYYEDRREST